MPSWERELWRCFRPLSGNHLWRLLKGRSDMPDVGECFRPLSGNHLWRRGSARSRSTSATTSFRPLSGNHLWRLLGARALERNELVFVPSRGITCGDLEPTFMQLIIMLTFSSPLGESPVATRARTRSRTPLPTRFSSPLGESPVATFDDQVSNRRIRCCFRPLSGNHLWRPRRPCPTVTRLSPCFRPLSGNHLWRLFKT